MTRDLTGRRQMEDALRQSEARLAGIIESAMDAIITVNEEQRIVVFNGAAHQMFGCPPHEAIGSPLERFIPDRFRAAHAGHIRAFGRTGVTSRSMWTPGTLVGLRSDGTEFPIEATISQVDTGGQRFFTVILRDVTERARAERQLRDALLAAQEANEVKADFLAMMSHELRTPLNAIAGYVQLLEMELRGPLTGDQRDYLMRIRRSGQHLMSVINDILNFARVEAGQLEYHPEDVPLQSLLDEVGSLLKPQLEGKGIAFVLHDGADRACGQEAEQVTVRCDPDKLRQILLNLMSNAAKFTERDGEVSMTWDADATRAHVRVTDTGRGIPADKLGVIFEPFVQLDRALKKPVDGTGLGLAISRQLARQMDGDISVASTPGVGSEFTLSLPRSTAVRKPELQPASEERAQSRRSR